MLADGGLRQQGKFHDFTGDAQLLFRQDLHNLEADRVARERARHSVERWSQAA